MLNKKSIKILSIVAIIMILLSTIGSSVFAMTIPDPDPSTVNSTNLDSTISTVLAIIQYGGIIAAVVIAMIIGIKYITSAPEGKAEVKKTATFYIAGIVLLLSASLIVRLIGNTIQPDSINAACISLMK